MTIVNKKTSDKNKLLYERFEKAAMAATKALDEHGFSSVFVVKKTAYGFRMKVKAFDTQNKTGNAFIVMGTNFPTEMTK